MKVTSLSYNDRKVTIITINGQSKKLPGKLRREYYFTRRGAKIAIMRLLKSNGIRKNDISEYALEDLERAIDILTDPLEFTEEEKEEAEYEEALRQERREEERFMSEDEEKITEAEAFEKACLEELYDEVDDLYWTRPDGAEGSDEV